MKKLTTMLLVFVSAGIGVIQAQVIKGAVFLGGDMGVSSEKTKNGNTTISSQDGLLISPVFGIAIKENLVFGGDAYYSGNKYNGTTPALDNKNRYRGLGIFLRKFKPLGESDFYLFIQGGLGYQYYHFIQSGTGGLVDDVKRSTLRLYAYPGVSYAMNKKLQLEAGFNNLLSLSSYSEKRTVSAGSAVNYKSSGFILNGSLENLSSLYIGFRLLLNK